MHEYSYMREEVILAASYKDEEWHKNHPWLLAAGEFWVANPFYTGEPVPHPEEHDVLGIEME